MTHDDSMQTYYAARAAWYDDVYAKPERQADLAFLQRHIPERFTGRRVLEIACGTGYWTQYIVGSAEHVLATDLLDEPMAVARQRATLTNVEFLKADAYALPRGRGPFSGAFAGLWYSHVPMQRRIGFLASLHGALQPGARVLLLDNSQVQCRDFPIMERDAQGNTWQHRPLSGGSLHRVLKNFPDETELMTTIAPFTTNARYRLLENFWLLEYELPGR